MSLLLILNNTNATLTGDIPKIVADEIRAKMSYVVPNFKFMARFKQDQQVAWQQGREPWDGTSTVARWKGSDLVFPSGLCSYMKEVMTEHQIKFSVRDERLQTYKKDGYTTPDLHLRDYQQKVSDDSLDRQRGVLKLATGGGKTNIAADMINRARSFPAMFYVTSCDLLEQTYDRFVQYFRFNGLEPKIGRIGGGHCDISDINLATVQSCQMALEGKFTKNSYDDVNFSDKTRFEGNQKGMVVDLIKSAQFVACDECQHVSSETIQSIMNHSAGARYRYGLSASPWRDDGLDILIEAAFGKRICDISASFLIKHNWLVRPTITFNHFNQALGPTASFAAHYSKYVVDNDARNQWIADRAQFHIERGRPTIILVKHVSHAENIAAKMKCECPILTSSGDEKKSSKKRKEILDKMRERKIMCVIATSLLDEGVDVPAAGAGIFAGGGKSSTRELQRVGRFIRLDPNDKNKEAAYIEEFFDHSKWLLNHAKTRRRILATEPEFEILDNRETMKF